jgi:hypothetical protein
MVTPISGAEAGTNAGGVRVTLDPCEVLSPDVAERLLDVMARMVVIAARVRTERAALEAQSPTAAPTRRSAARG